MPTDDLLIKSLVVQICKLHPLMEESVAVCLKDLLNGKLSEGHLSEGELRKVAKVLLELLVKAAPKGEKNNEN
ncbi:MAG: hypothetical protein R3B74_05435 [Nitrospirales bacterium]|nr:hypothetical protein [Nitrospirales bacterium]